MTKQELLKLFELEKIYIKYENHIPFCLSYNDVLTETGNFIYFFQETPNNLQLIIESTEFSNHIQNLEIHFLLNEEVKINLKKKFNNDIFPFLTFDTNFEAALKFIADFINKIMKPKYELKGSVSTY